MHTIGQGNTYMGKTTRYWITVAVVASILVGVVAVWVINILYGIVATLLLSAILVCVDWDYLLTLEDYDASREM